MISFTSQSVVDENGDMKYVQRLLALIFCFIFSMCLIFLSRINRESLKELKFGSNKYRCGRFPQESDIKYIKQLWQYVEVSQKTYRLAKAVMDHNVLKITMTGAELDQIGDVMFCQVWFDELPDTQPNVVRASDYSKYTREGKKIAQRSFLNALAFRS